MFKYAPCFLGGVVAWRLMRDTARLPGWLWPLAIVAASLTWMTAAQSYLPLHIAAFGICLGLAIPLFREIPWSHIRTASRITARYSYSIYLSHFPIMVYVFSDPRDPRFKLIRQLPPDEAPQPDRPLCSVFATVGSCATLRFTISSKNREFASDTSSPVGYPTPKKDNSPSKPPPQKIKVLMRPRCKQVGLEVLL
jgi:peptidoglycan/LPS O-acetylase OafA/YrhL